VDAVVQYDCLYDATSYIMVIKNALHVPSMLNNLIPPFMLREAGIVVHDTPKIQIPDPSVEDHSIFSPETGVWVPLSFRGLFSYFPTSRPNHNDVIDANELYVLMTSQWHPHQEAYASNEENILDWEGNLITHLNHKQILLSNIEDNDVMVVLVYVGSIEVKAVDINLQESASSNDLPQPCYHHVPREANHIARR
jgi:hypothetical protein